MHFIRRYAVLFSIACCYFATLSITASAQDYPNRVVKFVVPFAPGGPSDIVARILAQKLTERFNQSFIIENRPGGSANIGMVQVAKSPPDGYTILLVSSSFVINPALFANPGYDPYKDFAPLAMPVSSPNILVAHPSLPAKTMKEFLALVKANSGKYDYASPGNGSGPHLSAELLILQGGGDIKHIPYNGGAPAIQAVLGNQVALAFSALPPALPHINGQKLIPLAISSKSRFAALPAVPTIAESGFPDFEGDTQQFIMVPAGTPKTIIDLLNQEIIKIVNAPDTKDKLSSLGYSLSSHTPEQTGALIKTEIAKWTRVVKAGNIKPD